MALKRFVQSSNTGDRYPTGDHLNTPVYVQPIEKFSGLKTKHDENGENVVIRCNVYDLDAKEAFVRVVFFNDALVDGLGQYLGEEVVVRFVDKKSKDGKNTYRGIEDGTDADYEMAERMEADIKAAIAEREAELDAEGAAAGNDGPKQDADQAAAVKGAFKRS